MDGKMKIGIIGCGTVGGTLYRWLFENTKHQLVRLDPARGLAEDLTESDAIFICIPVDPNATGQDLKLLRDVVSVAKNWATKVFIRSTVLPGTNDELGTISAPEFLTDRSCDEDMRKYPILLGQVDRSLAQNIFRNKEIILMSNKEAELAKYTHNIYGAMKVTYFNIIKDLCEKMDIDFDQVKLGASLTGFINMAQHTKVPGPDGQYGFGGKCFPTNLDSFTNFMATKYLRKEAVFFEAIQKLNEKYREKITPEELEKQKQRETSAEAGLF